MSEPLRFGTYVEFQCPPGRDHASLIGDVLALAEHSDKNGFHVFTTLEHPFYEQFAINPNPLAVFTHLAGRTENLRFRALCHTLPLHNPMVLAGEIAMVDILTQGRIECGVGRGHPWLCGPADLAMEESMGRYIESLEILQKAWTEERFSYAGKYYNVSDVAVVPRTVQKPHPKIFQVGTSAKWFTMAAEKDWGVVVGGPAPNAAFKDAVDVYLNACAAAGNAPYVGFIKAIYIDEDEARAHEEAREAAVNFVRYNVIPHTTIAPTTDAERERLENAGYKFYTMDFMPRIGKMSYDDLIENDIVYVGTPERVGEKLQGLREEFDINELIIISHYGGLSRDQAMKTQQLFADRVMPMLQSAG